MNRYPKNRHFNPTVSIPGGGGIVGPNPSTNNAIAQWDGVTGTALKEITINQLLETGLNYSSDGFYELRHFLRPLQAFANSITGQTSVVSSVEIADGESVNIQIHVAGKRNSSNTGFGGVYNATWTKAAGVLNFVGEAGAALVNDMGGNVTVSTLDVAGAIRVELTNNLAANSTWSWVAYVTLIKL